MSAPFFISWRYQRGKKNNPLVSLISAFSTIGIALGVAVLIVGLSAMNGFERELNKRILAVVPQVEIMPYQNGQTGVLQNWHSLQEKLASVGEIRASSPFVLFTALIENGEKLKVAQIKGIDKNAQEQVSQLGKFVLDQGWQNFGEQGGLILGYGIAQELGVKAGDWVSLLIPAEGRQNGFAQPERQRIQISGILRLDGQLDHSYAILSLAQAQQFLHYQPQQVSGLELSVKKPFTVTQIDYSTLYDFPQPLIVQNWIHKFGYMYRDIQLIRTLMYIAMVLVIGVACFNIVSTLIMAVKDKQGDIAIMRTLGANDGFIKRIFIWYGLQAGMKGCLIGSLFGVMLALNLTELMQGVESLIGKKILSDGIYFIDFLPTELHWFDVILVFISALLLSLIASLYPAKRAAKLQPAQVLSNH